MCKSFISQCRIAFFAISVLVLLPAASIHATESIVFRDFFTDGNDAGWTQLNRAWRVANGRYILDGDYLPGAQGRDGFAVIHVGNMSWRNYVLMATFDNANLLGQPARFTGSMFGRLEPPIHEADTVYFPAGLCKSKSTLTA